jgi:hypothetical protein
MGVAQTKNMDTKRRTRWRTTYRTASAQLSIKITDGAQFPLLVLLPCLLINKKYSTLCQHSQEDCRLQIKKGWGISSPLIATSDTFAKKQRFFSGIRICRIARIQTIRFFAPGDS